MTSHDFALWLHGFTELTGGEMPSENQWKMIVEHLDLVFNKVTLLTGLTKDFDGDPGRSAIKLPVIRPLNPIPEQFKPRGLSLEEAQAELRRAAQEVADKRQAEAAAAETKRQREEARKLIEAKKNPQGPNRFAFDHLIKKPVSPEPQRRTVDDMYDDHFKEVARKAAEQAGQVPFYPQVPQPIQFPPNSPTSPGYPYPYYTLGVDTSKTLIC